MASSSTYFSSGAGRAVGSTLGAASGPGSGTGGGVNRETLKGLQDVVWSDDEVSHVHVHVGDWWFDTSYKSNLRYSLEKNRRLRGFSSWNLEEMGVQSVVDQE